MNKKLINTILKAVALAMGVAVVVMNITGGIQPAAADLLLGLGLAALAVALIQSAE